MPISHQFNYKKVETIDQTVDLLSQFGSKAKILAGGTDLIVLIKENHVFPDLLIDIKGLKALKNITFAQNILTIGANVTFAEIHESQLIKDKFYVLWEAAGTVASVGVRNAATLVGNICTAVPSLDSGPALLVLDAQVHVKSKTAERIIPIEKWFTGPKKTDLSADEMVVAISIKLPEKKYASCYKKLGRYQGEDLAQAGVGVLVDEEFHYKIAFCAVGPIPTRAHKIEALLNGKQISNELIQAAQKIVEQEISPITDIRSSKEYRMQMVKVMLERALKDAIDEIEGKKVKLTPII